jgi:hypothetical protein
MARKPKSSDELLADILTTLQDLLILQALATGATAASVRALVRVEMSRVNAVSKIRPKRKGD